MKKWEKYSVEEIQQIVKESYSYAELKRKLGYSGKAQSNVSVKEMISELNLDINHFTGQGWNKNNFDYNRFQYGKKIKSHEMLNAIVSLRGRYCEVCGREKWNDQEIPLEVHHIDGDSLNNLLDNLQLICPNCHALTKNWRGRNIKEHGKQVVTDEELAQALLLNDNIRQALLGVGLVPKGGNYKRAKRLLTTEEIKSNTRKVNYCLDCGIKISNSSFRCKQCENKLRAKESKDKIPYQREELKELIRNNSFLYIASLNRVSDNTIRKWCKRLNLPFRRNEINSYSEEEWNKI